MRAEGPVYHSLLPVDVSFQMRTRLLVTVQRICLVLAVGFAGNAAGFKAYDSPLARTIAVDAGIAVASANVAVTILPHQFGLRCDHCGVTVYTYFDVAQIESW